MNILNISLTGMYAASKRLSNSAQNVANIHSTSQLVNGRHIEKTPSATEVVQSSMEPTGGVRSEVRMRDPGTIKVFAPDSLSADPDGMVEFPNVSLEEEMMQQEISTYDYKANLKVMEAADDMYRSLLNIKS